MLVLGLGVVLELAVLPFPKFSSDSSSRLFSALRYGGFDHAVVDACACAGAGANVDACAGADVDAASFSDGAGASGGCGGDASGGCGGDDTGAASSDSAVFGLVPKRGERRNELSNIPPLFVPLLSLLSLLSLVPLLLLKLLLPVVVAFDVG